jgi:hypothetical protein
VFHGFILSGAATGIESIREVTQFIVFNRAILPILLRFLSSITALNSSPVFFHQHSVTAVIGARMPADQLNINSDIRKPIHLK